jgi:hypothetical protein
MRQLEDKVAVAADGSAGIGFVHQRFTEESTTVYIAGRRRFGKAQPCRAVPAWPVTEVSLAKNSPRAPGPCLHVMMHIALRVQSPHPERPGRRAPVG